jgi:chitinase
VVGYYPSWGTYARDFQVGEVAADQLTHLVYAFGKVTGGECAAGDEWADFRKPGPNGPSGNIGGLAKLKAAHPGLKVLWSFGGWSSSAGFTEAARDPERFAASCHRLLNDPRWAGVFDGIDIDWEYPNACGASCDRSGPDALARLLGALRPKFGLVSAAVPGDAGKLRKADYAAAARHADWLNAMTYDFFGTGSAPGPTAAHSALTAYPGIPQPGATAETTVRTLKSWVFPPRRSCSAWVSTAAAGPACAPPRRARPAPAPRPGPTRRASRTTGCSAGVAHRPARWAAPPSPPAAPSGGATTPPRRSRPRWRTPGATRWVAPSPGNCPATPRRRPCCGR